MFIYRTGRGPPDKKTARGKGRGLAGRKIGGGEGKDLARFKSPDADEEFETNGENKRVDLREKRKKIAHDPESRALRKVPKGRNQKKKLGGSCTPKENLNRVKENYLGAS